MDCPHVTGFPGDHGLCDNCRSDPKARRRYACPCWINGMMPGKHYRGCDLVKPSAQATPRQLRDAANTPWRDE